MIVGVAVRPDHLGIDRPTLLVDGRPVRYFSPDEAAVYAATMTTFAQRAEVVAGIKAQMTDPVEGIGSEATADLVYEFLAELPPPSLHAVRPLGLTLASSAHLIGRVNLRLGARAALWTPSEVRAHALDLLRASADLDLMRTYRRVLTGYMRLPGHRADLIVGDVRRFMASPRD